jgi:outer membrane biosynthesis protein TonB
MKSKINAIITIILISLWSLTMAQDKTVKAKMMGNSGNIDANSDWDSKQKYKLRNRTLVKYPHLDSIADINAQIVLMITVDTSGNVVNATGPVVGSSTSDSIFVRKSKTAAYLAKFNRAKEIQTGKMSFIFYKRKE